jgi:hypothetical protein
MAMKRISKLLATAVAVGLLLATPWLATKAVAAIITVCSSGCDFTSIQEAVDAAQPDDTIELGPETFNETVTVMKNIAIRGTDVDSTAVAGELGVIANRTSGAVTVSVQDVSFQNSVRVAGTTWGATYPAPTGYIPAMLDMSNCHVRGSSGCGLKVSGPSFAEVTSTTISGNGCGVEVDGSFEVDAGCGGYLRPAGPGFLTMEDSRVRDNAEQGVVSHRNSRVTITTTMISGNGTGIVDYGRRLALYRTTIAANSGWGIYSRSATALNVPPHNVQITTSTISDNAAGGIYVRGTGYYDYPEGRITNSTIVANGGPAFSGLSGGGYYGDPVDSSFILKGSIVADNAGGNCWTESLGHNLSGDVICECTQPTDITNTDPMLLPLADNGGPTLTHALAPGSPAIDSGDNECEPADQRGVVRPQDGDNDGVATCDLGAFEFEPATVLVAQLIDHVESLNLHHGIENSLLAKLNAASVILGDLQQDNDHAAANILSAFINHVEGQHGKKITAGDADALVDEAKGILVLLDGLSPGVR